MALLVRINCRTFTAAYMVWSSVAKEMRPRTMAGPPMKSRLLAAGLEWNTLTPVWDKGAFHQQSQPHCNEKSLAACMLG